MFNSISGIISAKFPKQLFLENNGIEWDLVVPDSNLDAFGSVGSQAKVYTWLSHTEQQMCLYGFVSVEERSVFLDLLKVDGVGPKAAVKIMSSVSSSRLMDVLEKGDLEMLEKIPGVGKKTAGKIMLTLKGKLKISEENNIVIKSSNVSPYQDLITSLTSMGYEKRIVEQKIGELVQELSASSDFNNKTQNEKEELLLRKAIVSLA